MSHFADSHVEHELEARMTTHQGWEYTCTCGHISLSSSPSGAHRKWLAHLDEHDHHDD